MKKILIIEDAELIRNDVMRILKFEQFETIGAANGKIGFELAKCELPDLILCDVMMPEWDGFDTLHAIKMNEKTADIPFVFLTALVEKSDLRKGMELGAEDYLTKPFTREELLAAIRTQLGKHENIVAKSEKKLDTLRENITLALPHELRTPISSILGFTEILKDQSIDLDQEERVQIIDSIHYSAKRLHRFIENFLAYTRIELLFYDKENRGKLLLEKTENPLFFLHQAIDEHKNRYNRGGQIKLESEEFSIQLPSEHLHKIFDELIDNACKFTRNNAPIYIKLYQSENFGHFEIINSGIQMTADQIRNIGAFHQFERNYYEQQGAGLGLFIVKRLADLYNGNFNVTSTETGETTVKINLPKGQ